MKEIELDPREKCCCFTGHRPEKWDTLTELDIGLSLSIAICGAMNKGFTTFISGGAKGVDIIAAEEVIDARENVNGLLKLVVAMPHPTFGRRWKDQWGERFDEVIAQADMVVSVSEKCDRAVYQRRNQWMVDHSGLVLAVYSGAEGGTRNTLCYARRKKVPVWTCGDEYKWGMMSAPRVADDMRSKLRMYESETPLTAGGKTGKIT